MSKFKFQLQSVLDIRETALQQAEIELEKAKSVVLNLKALLLKERDLYFEDRDQLNVEIKAGNLYRTKSYDLALESRKRRMIEIMEALRDAEEVVGLAEVAFLNARKDHKIIDTLREKRHSDHNKLEEVKETRFLEEQAIQRHARRDQQNSSAIAPQKRSNER